MIIGSPSVPARITLSGVPPTPIQIGSFACTGLGAISALSSGGRNRPCHVTRSEAFSFISRSRLSGKSSS
jgi:hypothetical protein